ncbi:hypothetical protein OJF2_14140 [Aquisphaera giovannonii]|uniref:Uncharacterized protein n=1 Tax=Aquisphaera giovannonii TaxID=406548 RepID=A0A5B9VXD1_9BACT|nr:hypothetical protein OJF2_14140 [Aquisphaera giovannonii]
MRRPGVPRPAPVPVGAASVRRPGVPRPAPLAVEIASVRRPGEPQPAAQFVGIRSDGRPAPCIAPPPAAAWVQSSRRPLRRPRHFLLHSIDLRRKTSSFAGVVPRRERQPRGDLSIGSAAATPASRRAVDPQPQALGRCRFADAPGPEPARSPFREVREGPGRRLQTRSRHPRRRRPGRQIPLADGPPDAQAARRARRWGLTRSPHGGGSHGRLAPLRWHLAARHIRPPRRRPSRALPAPPARSRERR